MTDSQGPQGGIFNFGPMESGMDHKGAGSRRNDGDGSFRDTILPLGSYTTVPDQLQVLHDLMDETFALENTIVRMIRVDRDAHVERRAFERVKGIDGVCGIQRDLELNMNVSRGGVHKDSGAAETVLVWFASCGMKKATANS